MINEIKKKEEIRRRQWDKNISCKPDYFSSRDISEYTKQFVLLLGASQASFLSAVYHVGFEMLEWRL
jgi:hypothetical protein